MNQAEILRDLRETKVTSASDALRKARLSLHVWGHATITLSVCDEFHIDMDAAADEYGWRIQRNRLTYSIEWEDTKKSSDFVIAVSDKPSAKYVREVLGKTKPKR